MTVQTILIVTAWAFAVIALSVSICARNKAKENVDWSDSRTNRLVGKVDAIEKARVTERSDYWWLVRRIESVEKKLAGECRDACRPRSYVTRVEGDGKTLVVLPERKKELCKEASKPHKVDEYCVGCNNLIALGGTKPACALDRKCKDFEAYGK